MRCPRPLPPSSCLLAGSACTPTVIQSAPCPHLLLPRPLPFCLPCSTLACGTSGSAPSRPRSSPPRPSRWAAAAPAGPSSPCAAVPHCHSCVPCAAVAYALLPWRACLHRAPASRRQALVPRCRVVTQLALIRCAALCCAPSAPSCPGGGGQVRAEGHRREAPPGRCGGHDAGRLRPESVWRAWWLVPLRDACWCWPVLTGGGSGAMVEPNGNAVRMNAHPVTNATVPALHGTLAPHPEALRLRAGLCGVY